ncbi:SDR family oxidoreductase [Rhizobium sp. IBUN]|uniref:SDR family oxidoreductase n=1 Tax=Rhizobium sp. IBUN TaxID=1042326 RepID=UPI0003FD93D5|nr:SDR family oxidoreductase [Rhizobium sp. IBUN]
MEHIRWQSGKAEEIAFTALFLASDESSYITRADIVVDGGWFSSAPYLGNERSHHMLELLETRTKLNICGTISSTTSASPGPWSKQEYSGDVFE